MRCANGETICFCDHPLDGSFVNGWLPERLRNYKIRADQDRALVVRELENVANCAHSMWEQTT